MVHIVKTPEELAEIYNLIPYPTRCFEDLREAAYPLVAKLLLIREWSDDTQSMADVVYIVTFDSEELSALLERDRVGIEGYAYAESEKEREATV